MLIVLVLLFITGATGLILNYLPLYLPNRFYEYSTEPHASDVLILLGGDPGGRVTKTLELFEQGYADMILVTGLETKSALTIQAAVPDSAILHEPSASSTWENATLSAQLISRELGSISSLTIVTDWWHTRRATACFAQNFPNAEIYTVIADSVSTSNAGLVNAKRREFKAILVYAIKHRMNPWALEDN